MTGLQWLRTKLMSPVPPRPLVDRFKIIVLVIALRARFVRVNSFSDTKRTQSRWNYRPWQLAFVATKVLKASSTRTPNLIHSALVVRLIPGPNPAIETIDI
jgi:hypothetical protein